MKIFKLLLSLSLFGCVTAHGQTKEEKIKKIKERQCPQVHEPTYCFIKVKKMTYTTFDYSACEATKMLETYLVRKNVPYDPKNIVCKPWPTKD